jgi:hypothetical protein
MRREAAMNTTLSSAGRVRRRLRLAAVAVTLLTVGCARYRVVEIDTTKARQFCWNRKVRITERTSQQRGLFAPRSEWVKISRIELVGEDDRNVVIHPIRELRGDKPYACVQDVGSPPDQYLVPLRDAIPIYQRARESMRVSKDMVEHPPENEARRKALDDAIAEYLRVSSHIGKRQFEKVSGAELAYACAFGTRQRESTYELDEHTVVRVRIEDKSLLTVTVEDQAGNVLHRYVPEELAVTEVENP